ncbi:MAG: zinc-dependent metalloprotease [Actinomycetota bacterium]
MASLIDPRVAAMVARRVSGEGGRPPDTYLSRRLERDLAAAVPRSEYLVAEVSGIAPPPPVEWAIVGRGDWAQANIAGMSTLIAPLADRLGERLESMPKAARVVQKGFLSAEVGLMLGYVSRRVLGQYDLLVPELGPDTPRWKRARRPGGGASLYFVGSNMVETEQKMGFVPEDFALWVAVHEVTHRFQFAGVPWLRDTFFELVESYLGSVEMDAKSFAARLAAAARKLVSRSTPDEERNAVYLFATEEQRALLDRMQALMAVVEGHGNFVMDAVGADVIPTFRRMRQRFDKRRAETNLIQRVINNAIGLEMKLRQYELGQRFCESVAAHGGHDALAHLWADPSNLPTLDELKTPERWVQRVA